ncbi:MAG TPA: cysteine desulfurase [Bacteroidia bacterium]|nr:cysteine desulfurase [Bacteroidia bacterium]HNG85178.1 cysteine desulfurase [Bacteroidia bacterium]HNI31099.1 cysteine desulfurase [Bacteroidia bacterium]HNJ32530.1 cysteine desulfurase [Bacteroidia bacterium]HNL05582.1 cysteine desulfurase [Bacteroidia bacterium]
MIKTATVVFDAESIRKDFPVLSQSVYGKPLVYLDNAATSQKPKSVMDALVKYYSEYNANIHRGVHFLSQTASQAYDDVRIKVKNFIHAATEEEIVFTGGTTDAINLVAATWGRQNIKEGDEIIISAMEHHSNIVPWQMLCLEKKAVLKVIPMNDDGVLLLPEFEKLLSDKTKIVAVVHTSNSLGTINPVSAIVHAVRQHEKKTGKAVPVLIDAAQAVVHEPIDVQQLDCDFLCFSAHKMLGPTGVGVLYGKSSLLNSMPPYRGGGDMIKSVSFEKTTYNDIPFRFEAGTPNIADVIAFGAAIDYLNNLDRIGAVNHEIMLAERAAKLLAEIDGVRLIGTAHQKTSVVSFIIDGVNALDAGMYLDTLGIAVRTGHHCTEPVMQRLKIPGTIRASFLFYNTLAETDTFVQGVTKAISRLRK